MPAATVGQRPSDTESAILDSAMMLFAEKGFSATTTRQIAQRAGVNEVTLFRHFRSKQELFLRILEEIHRLYPPLLDAHQTANQAPEEIITDFCRLTLRRCAQAPHLVRLMLYAMLDEVHELREYLIEKRVDAYSELLTNAMERLQREGRTSHTAPPAMLARLLMSQVFGLAQMSLLKLQTCELQHEEELARQITCQFVSAAKPAAPSIA